MLALTVLVGCRVQAPPKPCGAVMLGACVEPTVALAPCERGRARSLDDGSCTTARDARDMARTAGVFVDENDVIECESPGDELVASTRLGRVGCILREVSPLSRCPARTVPVQVPVAGACASLDHGGTVDLAAWSPAAAAQICAQLVRSPLALAAPETTLEVELDASVPNNDLTLGWVRVRTKPAVPETELARAVRPVDDALRRLGGTASASAVSGAATCRTTTRRPISVP